MRIKLTKSLPVDPKHGLTVGKVMETVSSPKGKDGVWVQGDGEKIRVLDHEYRVLETPDAD